MSTGFGANYADVISEEDLIRVCGKPAKDFFEAFDGDNSLDDFAYAFIRSDHDFEMLQPSTFPLNKDVYHENLARLNAMRKSFEENANGLTVGLYYHDQMWDGDIYDEVSGAYFHVEGLYELSQGGKALSEKGITISRAFYVTHG